MLGSVTFVITFTLVWIPGLYLKLITDGQNSRRAAISGTRGNIWTKLSSLTNYRNISNSANEIANLLTNHGNNAFKFQCFTNKTTTNNVK